MAAAPAAAPSAPPPSEPLSPAQRERDDFLKAALAFTDALLRGDPAALAAASNARFSFDGEGVEGRDAQARRWRELLAAREGPPGALRDLVLLTGPAATARLGAPPPRVAGLLRTGTWVAVADVSGRPVILFLVREGARVAVAGMHD